MDSRCFGSVIFDSIIQPLNTFLPMRSTLSGMTTSFNRDFPLNALFLISLTGIPLITEGITTVSPVPFHAVIWIASPICEVSNSDTGFAVSAALAVITVRSSSGIFCGREQNESDAAARMLRIRFRVCFIVTSFIFRLGFGASNDLYLL